MSDITDRRIQLLVLDPDLNVHSRKNTSSFGGVVVVVVVDVVDVVVVVVVVVEPQVDW